MRRDRRLDAVRGLAILLMVVDHMAAAWPTAWGVREVLTRAAMPLFMLLLGYLFREFNQVRHWQVVAAVFLEVPLLLVVAGTEVGILVHVAFLLPLMVVAVRYPWPCLGLALVQTSAWPMPFSGYEPGLVFAFMIMGHLMRRAGSEALQGIGEHVLALAPVGRYPLAIYCGHLFVLAGLMWYAG